MNIIAGSSNPTLAQEILAALQHIDPSSQLISSEITKFANDEKRVYITDENKVRGQKICLVQSFSAPVDEHVLETLLLVDALERLGAKELTLVIPWMGYSLQDKVFREGEAIAAKVVANVLSNTFIDRIFLLDLHNPSIPGFFSVPTYHLSAKQLFIEELERTGQLEEAVVVSPDFGGLKRARAFAQAIDAPLLNIDKSRDLRTGQVTAHALHGGAVADKNVLIFDDVIVSGGTVAESANLLKKEGAKRVTFIATHGIFCNDGLETIEQSQIDQLLVSNSIAQSSTRLAQTHKTNYLSLGKLFAQGLADWL